MLVGVAGWSSTPRRRELDPRVARSALVFVPLWLVGAGVNMWFGVSKAGYSMKEEIPFFFIVFLIPAVGALLVWWKYSRA